MTSREGAFSSLPEPIAQVGVDQLVDTHAHVADQRINGNWLVDVERPT
jgi:hypothetical protein